MLAQPCFLQKAAHREGAFGVEVLNGTKDILSSFLAVLGQRLDWVTSEVSSKLDDSLKTSTRFAEAGEHFSAVELQWTVLQRVL